MSAPMFALGLDYGTGSVRALIVDTRDGAEVATSTFDYPSGDSGVITDARDPNLARQNPQDYLTGLQATVREALAAAAAYKGFSPDRIVGIGVDTTGSTPIPVDRSGTPLALSAEFKGDPGAQAWLWKDHTSFAEAAEITRPLRPGAFPISANAAGRIRPSGTGRRSCTANGPVRRSRPRRRAGSSFATTSPRT